MDAFQLNYLNRQVEAHRLAVVRLVAMGAIHPLGTIARSYALCANELTRAVPSPMTKDLLPCPTWPQPKETS